MPRRNRNVRHRHERRDPERPQRGRKGTHRAQFGARHINEPTVQDPGLEFDKDDLPGVANMLEHLAGE